jgi:molybdate transport system substrate-binding protein
MSFFLRIGVLAFALNLVASQAVAEDIYCFAASSLTDALTEAGRRFETQSGSRVRFNFGASSMLARQIESGAPADLFFSADEQKMDQLQSRNLILTGTRKSILSNTLVIVTSLNLNLGSARELVQRAGRIAVADYNSVPAGIYAREHFSKLGIWELMKARVVPVQNARAALSAVESGNVDFAIVFKTDAQISKRVNLAYEIPRKEGPDIHYPIAVLKHSKKLALAKTFYNFLISPAGLEIFRKHGFLTRTEDRPQASLLPGT